MVKKTKVSLTGVLLGVKKLALKGGILNESRWP